MISMLFCEVAQLERLGEHENSIMRSDYVLQIEDTSNYLIILSTIG